MAIAPANPRQRFGGMRESDHPFEPRISIRPSHRYIVVGQTVFASRNDRLAGIRLGLRNRETGYPNHGDAADCCRPKIDLNRQCPKIRTWARALAVVGTDRLNGRPTGRNSIASLKRSKLCNCNKFVQFRQITGIAARDFFLLCFI